MKKVNNHILRYSNCWEDADLLIEGLEVRQGERVLSIGSAGDNCFSLLSCGPSKVVAVDMNRTQLHLIALKKAAFKVLDYEDFLEFLGFDASGRRWTFYLSLRDALDAEVRNYWDTKRDGIEAGVIHCGKFEHYFSLFRRYVLPRVHSQKKVRELFYPKSAAAQKAFYNRHWNTFRWRFLFRLFFSKYLMGRLGRDPVFLEQVEGNVGASILERAGRHLSSSDCTSNYFLAFILRGTFFNGLPHYARRESFERIKSQLDRLVLHHGMMEEVFEEFSEFDVFNCSDIFEYMPPEQFIKTADILIHHGSPQARYAYWNLLVPRSLASVDARVRPDTSLSESLTRRDKCFFYKGLFIDRKTYIKSPSN